jgi:phosphoribosylformimino-5-aminoimidazole carboxamide ribotide isomerase
MLIIPTIDLKEGRCVPLTKNVTQSAAVFSHDPTEMAEHWYQQGAKRLHLVDLEGALSGQPKNLTAIKAILKQINGRIPTQLGGGIRSLETIESYLDAGLDYVIISTAAIKTPGFLHDACDAFPGQVIVSLDAKDGIIVTDGWTKLTNHNVIELAQRFENYGIKSVIYTDIGQDGMLTGINIKATIKLAQALTVPVIAHGSEISQNDIKTLCEVEDEGIEAIIINKAIYEGTLNFSQMQTLANE